MKFILVAALAAVASTLRVSEEAAAHETIFEGCSRNSAPKESTASPGAEHGTIVMNGVLVRGYGIPATDDLHGINLY